MKKWRISILSLALTMLAGSLVYVAAEDQPKKELVTGQVECAYCHASRGDMGPNPAGCIERCLTKKGLPPVIVEEGTGKVYLAVLKGGESAVPKLVPLIGKKINAQGPVYRKDGLNVIEIHIVSEAL